MHSHVIMANILHYTQIQFKNYTPSEIQGASRPYMHNARHVAKQLAEWNKCRNLDFTFKFPQLQLTIYIQLLIVKEVQNKFYVFLSHLLIITFTHNLIVFEFKLNLPQKAIQGQGLLTGVSKATK